MLSFTDLKLSDLCTNLDLDADGYSMLTHGLMITALVFCVEPFWDSQPLRGSGLSLFPCFQAPCSIHRNMSSYVLPCVEDNYPVGIHTTRALSNGRISSWTRTESSWTHDHRRRASARSFGLDTAHVSWNPGETIPQRKSSELAGHWISPLTLARVDWSNAQEGKRLVLQGRHSSN